MWLAVLVVALVPVARVAMKPAARRELREHPGVAVAAAAVAIAAFGGVGWLHVHSPEAFAAVAALAALLAVAAWYRARPTYGALRGWPPGTLGLAASLDALADPDDYARRAREHGPVFKVAQFHRPVVCITDLAIGLGCLERHAEALAQAELPIARLIPGGYLEFMDGDLHRRYRETLRAAFTDAVPPWRPAIAALVRADLRALAHAPGSVPPPRAFAPLAFACLARLVFGLDRTDPRFRELERACEALDFRAGFGERVPASARAAFESLAERVRTIVAAIPAGAPGGAGSVESVAHAILARDPSASGDATLVGNLALMIAIGRDNLTGFLVWLAKLACDHPEAIAEIRAAADGDDASGRAERPCAYRLATGFVSEALRLWQSEYVYRVTLAEVAIAGFRVPRGWLVRVCLREAHRREDVFERAATFDPSRFADRRPGRDEYAPFSRGRHACLASVVVTAIAQTTLVEWAAGVDARATCDGPVERGNRHWHHWRPSRRLRIAFSPRSGRPAPEPARR